MAKPVWRNEKSGELFHDECFNDGESRDGYVKATLEELEYEDECASCSTPFIYEPDPDDQDDEVEEPEEK